MPTRISRKLARNGRRQPHDSRSSRGSMVTSAKAPAASRLPTETPSGAKPPQKPRWLRRCVLDQEDHRSAILGAGSEALHHAHRDQQRRRPIADLGIGRQQADRVVPMPIIRQRRHQHRLAPEAVAHDAEQDAAERPHHEADAEGQERQERADHRIAFGKEQIAEHQGCGGAVQEEVVPFQRGPDTGRENHAQARTIRRYRLSSPSSFPPF